MNRRQLLALLGSSVLLAGCSGQSVTRRFRVIATVDVYGDKVEGSTVMEISYSFGGQSLMGAGGASRITGEALILELKSSGTVYLLPITYERGGSIMQELYEEGILSTLGIRGSIGGLDAEKIELLKNAQGRMPFRLSSSQLPTLMPIGVAFQDETKPRSIYEVDVRKISETFPGVRFVNLEIEFTDAPVTRELSRRLPWTRSVGRNSNFPRDPAGTSRRELEKPLSHKLVEDYFYASGSR